MDGNKTDNALVVYESIYGNTHAIADAIAEGLRAASVDAAAVPAAQVTGDSLEGVSLVVAGGPTHAHGMSRPQLRESGAKAAAEAGVDLDPAAEGPWLREWFDSLGPGRHSGWAASFDTRFDMPELLTGHASKGILKKLERLGFRKLAEPESFLVTRDSHLLPGETERARAWGTALADELLHSEAGKD
ncbi:flavodoxin domain-containing protein [Sinomonas sp. JGH33]|uniref:Flavodoxin domain-containing protein n=1 Tax=Sinomonas terricola TaxID=3110330 RepID=A0ABU5T677_9MICC|nr:flavodoxin domain-containing protein [Sinomonas sp. JGH33]MEA5455167.1 flavodoxin domain-containing protein [Sinomonas sp. JGH33]